MDVVDVVDGLWLIILCRFGDHGHPREMTALEFLLCIALLVRRMQENKPGATKDSGMWGHREGGG